MVDNNAGTPQHLLEMRSSFIGDTWVGILFAADISMIVNLITGFEWNYWYGCRLTAVIAALFMLAWYSVLKYRTSCLVWTEAALFEVSTDKPLTLVQLMGLQHKHEQNILFLRQRGIALVSVTLLAVAAVLGTSYFDSTQIREREERASWTMSQIDATVGKVDYLRASVDSITVLLLRMVADSSGDNIGDSPSPN